MSIGLLGWSYLHTSTSTTGKAWCKGSCCSCRGDGAKAACPGPGLLARRASLAAPDLTTFPGWLRGALGFGTDCSPGMGDQSRGQRVWGQQQWERPQRCQCSAPSRGCRETWVNLQPVLPAQLTLKVSQLGLWGQRRTPSSAPQGHAGSSPTARQVPGECQGSRPRGASSWDWPGRTAPAPQRG